MKGLISLSLYGVKAKYTYGAVENARLAKTIYPDWDIRFYVERGHYAIDNLKKEGAQVVEMDKAEGRRGDFWRFLAADDTDYTHIIVRDADSRLNVRGAACVRDWVSSDKDLHAIRDHPEHYKRRILGGAWGMKTGLMNMAEAINAWNHNNQYTDDEKFLGEVVWDKLKHSCLRHSDVKECDTDVLIPDHPEYNGFICERIPPVFSGESRVVLLSPLKYKSRRKRFYQSAKECGSPLLENIEWHVGTTEKDRVLPVHFEHIKKRPHYFLATADHIDIIERAILDDVEYLFVFEDDASFIPAFDEYLCRMMAAMPADWLGAMLGGYNNHKRSYVDREKDGEAIARVNGCIGMHGVMWNRAGMIRGHEHFTYWNRKVIDQAFSHLQKIEPKFYSPMRWIVNIDDKAIQYGKDS
jgi:hypothetical protein